jgi:uncharacterized protein (DUF2164 family)
VTVALDEERLSDFRAEPIVDLMLGAAGSAAYNQSFQDARIITAARSIEGDRRVSGAALPPWP